MTIREFAERVLFGTTLEEKLTPPPAGVADVRRGASLATPPGPGRPHGLHLQEAGVRAAFPGTARLEDERKRGELLHFFANHELLATELMALVLLKFPGAPDEFRAGILRTLREEQMHTKLYLKRMAECGVAFGELPVNGFFWKAVAPMPSPVDYVTRLSLTFEQANLDYSRGYAAVFAEAGDADTAAILDRIYHDEIGHVHYGLTWFRRWKERRDESDWKAFTSRLALPLSAARAKGAFAFNEEGRREAGLDEEFIRELKVYAQSKGRTPNVFWFNPGAEESLVEGWDGTESAAARQVGRDLAMLPAYLARREDVVIVPTVPSTAFRTSLLEAGIELPELVSECEAGELAGRKLHELRPWARTPDAVELASRFDLPFQPTVRELFSKAEHASLLRELVAGSFNGFLCGASEVGVVATSVPDVTAWQEEHPDSPFVIKAAFSTAGRERLVRAEGGSLGTDDLPWIERALQRHGAVVVEPWVSRIVDFSIHYDRTGRRGLRRRGLVVIANSPQGQFQRATVAERFTDFLDENVRRALFAGASPKGHLFDALEELEPHLEAWLARHDYHGPLGVDAFLYRDHGGAVKLKPIVEVNPRYTMGRVALELGRFTPPNVPASLVISKARDVPQGGVVRLTPDHPAARFAAYLQVDFSAATSAK